MPPWGNRSCDSLLEKVAADQVEELVILPIKTFGDSELELLATLLPTAQSLTSITLSSSHQVSNDSSWKSFGKAILESQVLRLAIVGGMGPIGWNAWLQGLSTAQTVPTNCPVQQLNVSGNNLSMVDMNILCRHAHFLPALRELDLSRNRLSDGGLEKMSSSSAILFPSLTILDVSSCGLEGNQLAAFSRTLSTTIETIKASHNPIGSEGLTSLLENHPHCETLHADNCSITKVELPTSISASGIASLYLAQNPLSSCVVASLCNSFPKLQTLDVSNHPKWDDSIDATLLARHPTLRTLDLSQTACSVASVITLLTKETMVALRLFACPHLDASAFFALAHALRESGLHTLDVAGNGVSNVAAVVALMEAANETPCLTTLVVGGNVGGPIIEEAVQRLRPTLHVARDLRGSRANSFNGLR